MKKSQLKTLIKRIIKEAIQNEILGFGGRGQGLTPAQQKVIDLLQKRSFQVVKYVPNPDKSMDVILQRPYGKGKQPGPRFARVHHDGTINQDKMDVNKFLQVVGESMSKPQDPRFNDGREEAPMGAVNIGEECEEEGITEETGTGAVAGYSTPFAFSKKGGGSSRAIKAAKKYGKVVKSISEIERK